MLPASLDSRESPAKKPRGSAAPSGAKEAPPNTTMPRRLAADTSVKELSGAHEVVQFGDRVHEVRGVLTDAVAPEVAAELARCDAITSDSRLTARCERAAAAVRAKLASLQAAKSSLESSELAEAKVDAAAKVAAEAAKAATARAAADAACVANEEAELAAARGELAAACEKVAAARSDGAAALKQALAEALAENAALKTAAAAAAAAPAAAAEPAAAHSDAAAAAAATATATGDERRAAAATATGDGLANTLRDRLSLLGRKGTADAINDAQPAEVFAGLNDVYLATHDPKQKRWKPTAVRHVTSMLRNMAESTTASGVVTAFKFVNNDEETFLINELAVGRG